MSNADGAEKAITPLFPPKRPVSEALLSSSPGFGTPIHPIIPITTNQKVKPPAPPNASILPILLPPATLRPVAFRTITKKHNLTLTSPALQQLATFIGRNCGPGWREEGLAEKALDEVAKQWKRNGGGVILEDGQNKALTSILQGLEGSMSGGKIVQLTRANSFASSAASLSHTNSMDIPRPGLASREDSQTSIGMSVLNVSIDEDDSLHKQSARSYIKVVSAYDQPRLEYNPTKKFFEPSATTPSLFPPPSHKTAIFQSRFNLIHQRLLRNESFQTPTFAPASRSSLRRSDSTLATTQNSYKITQIANLLGRSGSSHLLLGLLVRAPTGDLSLADLTGSISLNLHRARPVPEDGAWFCPGMIVLVDGVYKEEGGSSVGNSGGIGGTIGGRFIGISIGGPPCERREVTLGSGIRGDTMPAAINAGFGWVDFLGTGSEKAQGERMRQIQAQILGYRRKRPGPVADSDSDTPSEPRTKIAIFADLHLDNPRVLASFRMTLSSYSRGPPSALPLAFILMGSFASHAAMAGSASGGSVEYKERFDTLASVLGEFPTILATTTLIFVPGDNDPWASAFSAGSATPIPRDGIPELFTNRIKRAVAAANAEVKESNGMEKGEVLWTSNPSRVSAFGPVGELVLFRDDISGRLRRSSIVFRGASVDDDDENEETKSPEVEMQDDHHHDQDGLVDDSRLPPEEMDLDPAIVEAESRQPPEDTAAAAAAAARVAITASATDRHHTYSARKLVKTLLDQGNLSPFPVSTRPVLWDYASTLSLYPLPNVLVLADAEVEAFSVTYEGCCIVNPGAFVAGGAGGGAARARLKGEVKWCEVEIRNGRWRGGVRRERY